MDIARTVFLLSLLVVSVVNILWNFTIQFRFNKITYFSARQYPKAVPTTAARWDLANRNSCVHRATT